MQNEAYKITGFTAVAAAMGFLIRWLQNMKIIDVDTGLAIPGARISVIVALMFLAVTAVIGAAAWRMKRYDAPLDAASALGGERFVTTAVYVLPALLLFAAGVVQLLTADAEHFPETQVGMRRVFGVSALLGAAGTALLGANLKKNKKAGVLRLGIGLLLFFSAMWLITEYKSAASDPVLWRTVPEVFAICMSLLAYYYIAGYFFQSPGPRGAVFSCFLGAYFCIVSAVDEHPLCESITFVAAAIQLMAWGYHIVRNLQPAGTLTSPEKDDPESAQTAE